MMATHAGRTIANARVDEIDWASDRLEARLMRRTRCEFTAPHGDPVFGRM